jgi:dihydrofolate reductase
MSPRISIIAAMSEDNVIGRNGDLPWHLATDLKRFKRLTTGHTVIVGRKTHEAIVWRLGRPLPGRRTIVLSRNPDFVGADCEVVQTLPEALARVNGEEEVFIIGGVEIYRSALESADHIYLTRVHATVTGDAIFPSVDFTAWTLLSQEQHARDAENDYDYSFEVWERVPVTAAAVTR